MELRLASPKKYKSQNDCKQIVEEEQEKKKDIYR